MGNHVVILQSQAWQSRSFENHLNWLLARVGALAQGDYLELSDRPKAETRRKAERNDVKAITLRAPVVELQPRESARTQRQDSVFVPFRRVGAEVIRAVLGNDEFEKLHLDRAAGGNLRVDLRITFERTTTDSGQQVMNALARVFRHADIEPEDFEIHVPGVGKIRGDELKLSEQIRVETNNGLVSPNALFPLMHDWLKSLIENGLVDTD
jgi:hypothetical protein